ncbi:MAG TPA: sugar ABC transporter substrate-binding protein, partial [Burkholderiaceae bacterium]|nr:sugar ABC transporter substrate-binding protein [Burkholderiaceae bacterium]
IPISESASRVPPAVEDLLRRYGPRWTHALAINDIYFDHAVQVLARVANPNYAPVLISAGDGSAAALLRIRSGAFQQGTVAEPLNMQGWQMVDELNRLFAGVPLSGFVPPVRLLTRESLLNLPDGASVYDPNNGYRGIYRALWKQGRYP